MRGLWRCPGLRRLQIGWSVGRPGPVPVQYATAILQNALGGDGGVTCCSLALSVLAGPGLSNDPMLIGSGSLNLVFTPVSQVPLPAALPLFATGLGVLGLLGWRRKRKAV